FVCTLILYVVILCFCFFVFFFFFSSRRRHTRSKRDWSSDVCSSDLVSPLPELTIEKDANGDPTGVFIENGMQPTAELIWFRKPTEFSRGDRARGLPVAARAYHAFGTTSVFEGHGVANEVIRAYKDAHRDGMLTMRAGLVFSPNWKTAGNARLESLIDSWAGLLGEPASGDDLL